MFVTSGLTPSGHGLDRGAGFAQRTDSSKSSLTRGQGLTQGQERVRSVRCNPSPCRSLEPALHKGSEQREGDTEFPVCSQTHRKAWIPSVCAEGRRHRPRPRQRGQPKSRKGLTRDGASLEEYQGLSADLVVLLATSPRPTLQGKFCLGGRTGLQTTIRGPHSIAFSIICSLVRVPSDAYKCNDGWRDRARSKAMLCGSHKTSSLVHVPTCRPV